MYVLTGFVVTAAIFVAVVFSLALKPRIIRAVTGYALVFSAVSGLILYGAGYARMASGPFGVLGWAERATISTAIMFVGKNDYSTLAGAMPELSENMLIFAWFWLAHLLAFYTMASTALTTLGRKILQQLRLRLLPLHDVLLVYGINERSIEFARGAAACTGASVLFIGQPESTAQNNVVLDMGACVLSEEDLLQGGGARCLRRLGLRAAGHTRLEMAAFGSGVAKTQKFLRTMLETLRQGGIPAERVRLVVNCNNEYDFSFLQNAKDREGALYQVELYSVAQIVARQLILAAPPYRTMSFDEKACAMSDFRALIIGFGDVGQAVLRNLVMNGQFAGSRFHAKVVDKDISGCAGAFRTAYGHMIQRYNIEFENWKAEGEDFWQWAGEALRDVNYVVVCTGNEKTNAECAARIRNVLFVLQHARTDGKDVRPTILAECSKKQVILHDVLSGDPCVHFAEDVTGTEYPANRLLPAMNPVEILYNGIDRMAYAVNTTYITDGHRYQADPWESWKKLDAFSRASSRASADYIPALLHQAGIPAPDSTHLTAEAVRGLRDAIDKLAKEEPEKLENLSHAEHDRWVAFHEANGVGKMSVEEMARRAKEGIPGFHKCLPPRGMGGRHICMVEWEELDALSDAYNACLPEGSPRKDWKRLDTNNVISLPDVYRELYRYQARKAGRPDPEDC